LNNNLDKTVKYYKIIGYNETQIIFNKKEGGFMKSKVISILILSITLFLSITLILASVGLSKPKLKYELITFEGDLDGSQEIAGCCPNAGPFPEYTMFLSNEFPNLISGKHEGQVFMNRFGAGKTQSYKVQFWWTSDKDYFIEIIGGNIEENKKMKILTVTFVEVPCRIWINNEETETINVNFILTRTQL
jgi:hypothetical protein